MKTPPQGKRIVAEMHVWRLSALLGIIRAWVHLSAQTTALSKCSEG